MEASGRIVVFGATGFTGELVVRALVAAGVRPVVAGRSAPALAALAARHGDLPVAVADVTRPDTVRALVGPGDVLISTVGPFARWGEAAVEAAVQAGAAYLDTTGEPSFVRAVFERWSPLARQAGVPLLTAMGYDYVPGNLAAAVALEAAGEWGTAVDVGYFVQGPRSARGLSAGTRASLAGSLLEPGLALRAGVLRAEPAGVHARRFLIDGRRHSGVSIGGSEHAALTQSFPGLREVHTYLGWFGPFSPAVSLAARTVGRPISATPLRGPLGRALSRLARGSGRGPQEGEREQYATLVIAEARDGTGRRRSRAVVRGPNPYDVTGALVAWAAGRLAEGTVDGVGALGPVSAFGLPRLLDGAGQAGLAATVEPLPG